MKDYRRIYKRHDLFENFFNGYGILQCKRCGQWRPLKGYPHPGGGWDGVITNYKKCVCKPDIDKHHGSCTCVYCKVGA